MECQAIKFYLFAIATVANYDHNLFNVRFFILVIDEISTQLRNKILLCCIQGSGRDVKGFLYGDPLTLLEGKQSDKRQHQKEDCQSTTQKHGKIVPYVLRDDLFPFNLFQL